MTDTRSTRDFHGLFGTDGIRGKAGFFPMTTPVATLAGRAMIDVVGGKEPTIIVGRDTRFSGPALQAALIAGLCSAGARVLDVGVFPTGGVSLLCHELEADGGVVISASHNPAVDNGIKLFGRGGRKLQESVEQKIEGRMAELAASPHEVEMMQGIHQIYPVGHEIYERRLLKASGLISGSLSGIRLAVDCANGSAHQLTPVILRRLGATLELLGTTPNGRNINLSCGSQHLEPLAQRVLQAGCDAGIALDGDADRVIFIDDQGTVCDGDHLLAMLAVDWTDRGHLRGDAVVATVMSNFSLERFLGAMKVKLVRTAVGDKNIQRELEARGSNLGGEQSGHLIFPDHCPTGDGLLTALMVLRAMCEARAPLSQLAGRLKPAPQILLNVAVREKIPFAELANLRKGMAAFEEELRGEGRILVRYSGTENLLRIMVEGSRQDVVKRIATDLAEIAKQEIGE